MSTIARLVVEIGANAQGVRRELDRASKDLQGFSRVTEQTFKAIGKGIQGGILNPNQAAETIFGNLQKVMSQRLGKINEDLFRGVLSPEGAKKAAQDAGTAYNASLLASISQLKRKGALDPDILLKMQNDLRQSGLKGGKELADGILKGAGEGLTQIGNTLLKSVTLPLIGAGGVMANFAGESELAGKRLGITFGPMTDQIDKALSKLHESVPATVTELRNMTATTAELLLPLGIAPKAVGDMSVNLVRLSKDLAILRNVSPERALNALQSGLIGLTRPLRQLGIEISDKAINLKAVQLGLAKTGETLSDAGRAMAAYALITERMGITSGAASKLQDTFLVQLRFVKRDAVEAGIAIGQQLVPALLPLITIVKGVLQQIAQMPPGMLHTIVAIGLFVASVGPMLIVLGQLAKVFRIGLIAIKLFQTEGIVALGAALLTNPIGLAILAVAAAMGVFYLASRTATQGLDQFRVAAANLDRQQVNRAATKNIEDQIALMERRDELLKQPQSTTVRQFNPGLGSVVETSAPTEAAKTVEKINQVLRDRGNIALALGERMKVLNQIDADAEEQTAHWNELMKQFASNFATTVPKVKTAMQELKDSATAVTDRLAIFRELNLDITAPLSDVQAMYDAMIKKIGGVNHLQDLSADRLGIILQLQRAINQAVDERNKAPTVAANTAFQNLQDIRAEAVQTGSVDIKMLQAAYAETVNKLKLLDAANKSLGDQASPEALRTSARIHKQIGSDFDQFAAALGVELDKGLQQIAEAIPQPAVEGVKKFYQDLADLHNSNRQRFAGIKTAFNLADPVVRASTGAGALDLLGSAALSVAEKFTPLAILADLIGVALEPLEPALKALMLPLEIVARIIGASLIPILRLLWPIFRITAIAATYIGQIFYTVAAAILRSIGALVRGLGRLINKLPGSPGDPLVKAGQAMLDLADGFSQSSKDLGDARKQLQDMSFDDAINQVNGLAKAAKDASQNIPQIFKMAKAVFDAANPQTGTVNNPTGNSPAVPTGSNPSGGSGGVPKGPQQQNTYQITIVGSNKSARQLLDEINAEAERRRLAETGTGIASET